MKLCEICEDTEACVEVKRYENGELRALSLCAACAQKHGLELPANLADLLLKSTLAEVTNTPKDELTPAEKTHRCPVCRMRLADFRKTGRLGCPACYTAWIDTLEPMLMGMHRSLAYKGASPSGSDADTEGVKQALLEAIAREDYEEAARLRDRIRGAESRQDIEQGEFSFDEGR